LWIALRFDLSGVDRNKAPDSQLTAIIHEKGHSATMELNGPKVHINISALDGRMLIAS
ncbi:hypothetical protein T08_12265, partial [Trichinella sp. T8]